jgi:hypothetical protein
MDRERWQKVGRVFKFAPELPTEESAAFVERACAAAFLSENAPG